MDKFRKMARMEKMTHRSQHNKQQGFNLVEVLVALLVLAVGLLGMAALQNFSLASTSQSYQRTQAILAIQEILDKMRANPSASATGLYSIPAYTRTPPTMVTDCALALCTPSSMAAYDMNTWMTSLTGSQAIGPTAQAKITVMGNVLNAGGNAVGTTYEIGIQWVEGNSMIFSQTMTVEMP